MLGSHLLVLLSYWTPISLKCGLSSHMILHMKSHLTLMKIRDICPLNSYTPSMDLDTGWRENVERCLEMEHQFTLGYPSTVPVSAVYVKDGEITAVVDRGQVNLKDGVLDPSGIRVHEPAQRQVVLAAAMCTCPLTHEEVAAGNAVNMKVVPIDLSKSVMVPRVLPDFASLLSVYIFIGIRPKMQTRKTNVRKRLRASRRVLSNLKQE